MLKYGTYTAPTLPQRHSKIGLGHLNVEHVNKDGPHLFTLPLTPSSANEMPRESCMPDPPPSRYLHNNARWRAEAAGRSHPTFPLWTAEAGRHLHRRGQR